MYFNVVVNFMDLLYDMINGAERTTPDYVFGMPDKAKQLYEDELQSCFERTVRIF